jgi:hypothetical protein
MFRQMEVMVLKTEFELMILKYFGSYKKAEKSMKWGQGAVTKIVRGLRELKGSEIDRLSKVFYINDFQQFKSVFFDFRLPNGNTFDGESKK